LPDRDEAVALKNEDVIHQGIEVGQGNPDNPLTRDARLDDPENACDLIDKLIARRICYRNGIYVDNC
jgi:hypothetical protein